MLIYYGKIVFPFEKKDYKMYGLPISVSWKPKKTKPPLTSKPLPNACQSFYIKGFYFKIRENNVLKYCKVQYRGWPFFTFPTSTPCSHVS